MKVLVTGGSGFVGSNVADVLEEQGYDITDMPLSLADRAGHERDVAATRGAMGHDSFEAACVAGGALAPKAAIATALARTAVYGYYGRK
jgi:nucleoside-diphosphate-sugar epimerase